MCNLTKEQIKDARCVFIKGIRSLIRKGLLPGFDPTELGFVQASSIPRLLSIMTGRVNGLLLEYGYHIVLEKEKRGEVIPGNPFFTIGGDRLTFKWYKYGYLYTSGNKPYTLPAFMYMIKIKGVSE